VEPYNFALGALKLALDIASKVQLSRHEKKKLQQEAQKIIQAATPAEIAKYGTGRKGTAAKKGRMVVVAKKVKRVVHVSRKR